MGLLIEYLLIIILITTNPIAASESSCSCEGVAGKDHLISDDGALLVLRIITFDPSKAVQTSYKAEVAKVVRGQEVKPNTTINIEVEDVINCPTQILFYNFIYLLSLDEVDMENFKLDHCDYILSMNDYKDKEVTCKDENPPPSDECYLSSYTSFSYKNDENRCVPYCTESETENKWSFGHSNDNSNEKGLNEIIAAAFDCALTCKADKIKWPDGIETDRFHDGVNENENKPTADDLKNFDNLAELNNMGFQLPMLRNVGEKSSLEKEIKNPCEDKFKDEGEGRAVAISYSFDPSTMTCEWYNYAGGESTNKWIDEPIHHGAKVCAKKCRATKIIFRPDTEGIPKWARDKSIENVTIADDDDAIMVRKPTKGIGKFDNMTLEVFKRLVASRKSHRMGSRKVGKTKLNASNIDQKNLNVNSK